MIIIDVNKSGGVEKALKTLKRKYANMRTLRELRDRQSHTKKSVRRRTELLKAKYIQEKQSQEPQN